MRFGLEWQRDALILTGLAAALALTNPWFTVIDDEVTMLGAASQPAGSILQSFSQGFWEHQHPPLFDLWLHAWLLVTGGRLWMLRLPSIFFYVAAIWLLQKTAREITGRDDSRAVLWIGALSAYGFHYGRLVGWWSFAFFWVALLTHAFFQYFRAPSFRRWILLVVAAAGLVFTNYFGWALLACLAVESWVRYRSCLLASRRRIAVTLALFLIAYLPLLGPLVAATGERSQHSILSRLILSGYFIYALFVSESIAPWFLALSVPAALAIAACAWFVLRSEEGAARRFFLYFLFLNAALCFLNLGSVRRLMLIAPWAIFPLGLSFLSPREKQSHRTFLISLVLIATVAWLGVFSRRFYSSTHSFEPWPAVARDVAAEIRGGAIVVSDSLPLFFYLTYELFGPPGGSGGRFPGVVADSFEDSRVFSAGGWKVLGHRRNENVLLVMGGTTYFDREIQEARAWLDARCRLQGVARELPNPGFEIKQRYFPQWRGRAWRIQISRYTCH